MKPFLLVLLAVMTALLVLGGLHAREPLLGQSNPRVTHSDPAFHLVFFSVLEGCFQDGLSDEDVDQILLVSTPGGAYEHFIYNCPICSATARALETYRARPDAHMKVGGKICFGGGLTSELHARLYSTEAKERLSAIHDLEQNWIDRRVASMRFDPEETATVQKQLKDARDEGIRIMQMLADQGVYDKAGSAYHKGDECAVCNAAAGMSLKLAPRE